MSETKEIRPTIVVAALLTITQSDANELSAKCPYQVVEGKENLIYVMPGALDAEMIKNKRGKVLCVHYVRDTETNANSIAGEWEVYVPITQTVNKNIFTSAYGGEHKNVVPYTK